MENRNSAWKIRAHKKLNRNIDLICDAVYVSMGTLLHEIQADSLLLMSFMFTHR
jgi:hypothetical protein